MRILISSSLLFYWNLEKKLSQLLILLWTGIICLSFRYKGFVFDTYDSVLKYTLRKFNQTFLLFVPLFFINLERLFEFTFTFRYICISIGIPLFYWIINFKKAQLLVADFAYIPGDIPTYIYIINIVNSLFLIVGEEIFFRYIVYYYFLDKGFLIVVFLSNFLFILSHIISTPNGYSKCDILRQIFFSTLCCYTLLQTNNIIYTILIHFIYNLPFILVLIRRSIFNKDNVDNEY